ncbi:uncharacterized protein KGF55_002543 [Candida pseudojiufengensis]|uniref:uncharacterized protein n=1 Tax=Candida pseudojiufengensis TaxID=497109 RepID=UPI0022251413|nr:uncharacterized protein KGF55_002543 [Candida pseudojiufengensis]KAI5963663.1 hypothetical protein KGF55_002543 [Candida pseudojiufengensis]
MTINKETSNGAIHQTNGDVSSNTSKSTINEDTYYSKKYHESNDKSNQFKKKDLNNTKIYKNKHHQQNMKRKVPVSNITVAFNAKKDDTNGNEIVQNNVDTNKYKEYSNNNKIEENIGNNLNDQNNSSVSNGKSYDITNTPTTTTSNEYITANGEEEILENLENLETIENLEKFENQLFSQNCINQNNEDDETLSSPPPPPSEVDFDDDDLDKQELKEHGVKFKLIVEDNDENPTTKQNEFIKTISSILLNISSNFKVFGINRDELINEDNVIIGEKNEKDEEELEDQEENSNTSITALFQNSATSSTTSILDYPMQLTSPFLQFLILKANFSNLNLNLGTKINEKFNEIFNKLNSLDLNFKNFIIEMFINESDWEIKENYLKQKSQPTKELTIFQILIEFFTINFVFLQIFSQFLIILLISFLRLCVFSFKCLFKVGKQHLHID